jgi:phosphoadenosine phosphosulfate reductase
MVMDKREENLTFESKEKIANTVIEDVFGRFSRPVVVWSAGKDSTVVLYLVKKYVESTNKNMPPALFLDHGQHYEETLAMLEKVSKDWGFRVISTRNDDFLSKVRDGKVLVSDLNAENRNEVQKIGFPGDMIQYNLDTDVGNHLLKTVPMQNAISRYRFDALFVGVRWDENPARGTEVFLSRRNNPEHFRAHPILTFNEKDVWSFIFKNKLPIHPLYYKGYRSIDGKNDSKPISDKPAWEQDLDNTSERAGRSQDKEGIMEKLRNLGYM